MAAGGHFGCLKITFDLISIHFTLIRNFNFFLIFDKMAAGGHCVCPKITFDLISIHFTTLICLDILEKMADIGHLGCPNFTFDRFPGHFISICNFNFFGKFLTKWLPAAILDGTTISKIELVRDIWMSNACVKLKNVV